MSEVIELVQGDALPSLELTLKDANTGDPSDPDSWDPIDLSAGTTTVNVLFRARNSDVLLSTMPCTKVGGGSTGQLTMPWPAGVLDNDVGRYEGQIEIDFDGDTQTVPEELEFKIIESFN